MGEDLINRNAASLSDHFIQKSRTDDADPGQCAKGVANILESVGAPVTRKGSAYEYKDMLPQQGWKKLEGITPENAPAGAVIVYDRDPAATRKYNGRGSEHGHVEIVAIGSNGHRSYVSDKARDNYGGTVPDNFVGVYVHPMLTNGSDIQLAEAKNKGETEEQQRRQQLARLTTDGDKPNPLSLSGNAAQDQFNSKANVMALALMMAIISKLFGIDTGGFDPKLAANPQPKQDEVISQAPLANTAASKSAATLGA